MHPVTKSAILYISLGAALLVLCDGCSGGSSVPPPPPTLSSTQATAAATEIEQSFVAASGLIGSNRCPTPPSTQPGAEDLCSISVANSVPCGSGGTVATTGLLTGDVDFTDSGTFTGTLTETPTNCAIPGTAFLINGDPGLSTSGNINFYYGGVTSFAVAETGSVTYGTAATQTCSVNLTITASFIGDAEHTVKSCTLVGTACGTTVNLSCVPTADATSML